MNLAKAQAYAEKIAETLAPFCEQIEIAGSIRRRRPEVNDIDLVILPTDLQRVILRCRESCIPIQEGSVNLSYKTPLGIQLDIFCARSGERELFRTVASNWGSILLCRTGSKEHNIKIAQWAKTHNMEWNPYQGILDHAGMVIASETEEAIFRAIGMPFIKPELRECLNPPRCEAPAEQAKGVCP